MTMFIFLFMWVAQNVADRFRNHHPFVGTDDAHIDAASSG